MNLIHGLRRRLARRRARRGSGPRRLLLGRPNRREPAAADAAPVAFDQVERLTDSGASLESLLEMNRVQGW